MYVVYLVKVVVDSSNNMVPVCSGTNITVLLKFYRIVLSFSKITKIFVQSCSSSGVKVGWYIR